MNAFGRLLDEKPLNKITVRELTEKCGVSRNTFYYHFQNIPHLLGETLEEKADWLIQNHYRPGSPIDCICPLIRFGMDRRRAVLHIYRAIPREEFIVYLERVAGHIVGEYFDNASAEMTPSAGDRQILTGYYKCMLVGVFLDWLDSGMNYDLMAAAQRICRLFAGSGRRALERSAQAAASAPGEET